MIRQGSNLSKPNSRQTPRTTPRQTPGKNNRRVGLNDNEFDKAMEKQMSSLEKKKTTAPKPRLGAPEAPKLGAPPKPPTPEPEPEPIQEENAQMAVDSNQTDETKKLKKRKQKKDGGDKASDDYSLEFESGSDDDLDIITKVRDENNKFVLEKFDSVMKAFSEASELPDINDAEFDNYMEDQKQLILRREQTHTDWLENFSKKKERVLLRLGTVSRNRGERFNEVCNIAAGLMGMPEFPPIDTSSRKNSISQSQRNSRSRSRDRGRSRDRSLDRDRSRGRSRERSYDRLKKNSSEVLPEIVDIKDEIANSSPKKPATPIGGAPPIKGVA